MTDAAINPLHERIAAKKAQLDRLRPLPPEALSNLEHYYDVEITYTSNAIEGNKLSPVETTLVIEQGVTIAGKPLKDHLEALDHYDAIRYVRELAREQTPVTESDVRNLHRLVMQRSRPDVAGCYADLPAWFKPKTTFAPKSGATSFLHRPKSRRLWATSPHGLAHRPHRRRRRSWLIEGW